MSKDLEVIKQIAVDIHANLELLGDKNFLLTKGYSVDSNQNVTALYLNQLLVREIPDRVFQLYNLKFLDLSYNYFSTLPKDIGFLKNLQTLNLSYNKLAQLPEEIGQLLNLKELDLSGNSLIEIPFTIGRLKNLIDLKLTRNKLKKIPANIGELRKLYSLSINHNELSALPKEFVQLKSLNYLDLRYNQFSKFPPEVRKIKTLKALHIYENPLELPPPEIIKQGIHSILEYFRQLMGDVVNINEAKLVLVGQGNVGKTCLAKRLMFDVFQDEQSTQGIDVFTWGISAPTKEQEKIDLNVWDFGGQEIYHATHQFFLTKRSVYLLVWNARRSRDYENIYYWLHTIEAFAGISPIILVMSKLSERDDDLNMKDIKEAFPQVMGLYKIDSKDGRGIPALKETISRTTWTLPHMQTAWSQKWFNIRERLERDERDWIDYQEFCQICNSEGLIEQQIQVFDEYLHDLGVIIHFRDRLELQNIVILKPEWATKAVYKILDSRVVLECGGVLQHSILPYIWDTNIYPTSVFPKLLELMNKFELAYKLPDQKSHLVAGLLPSTEVNFEWEYSNNLCFYYRYDFIPAGVMTRFIVLVHRDLELREDGNHVCWREGAVLQREETRAFVKVRPMDKLIEIRIVGLNRRELLAIIRREFDHIHSSIEKIRVTEQIPCNCSPQCTNTFDYTRLLNAERKGKPNVECQETWKDVNLSILLDGYILKEKRQQRRLDEGRIFSASEATFQKEETYETMLEMPDYQRKEHNQTAQSKMSVKNVKILFLGANPVNTTRLRLDEEVKQIQTNLRIGKERDNLEFRQEWALTTDSLMQAVLDETPEIIHFSGHGHEQGIFLEGEAGKSKVIPTEALAYLFSLFKETVKCVVLNSCYSEKQGEAIKANIPYVIALKFAIPDKCAIAFSTGFYKAIGAGKDIEFAFKLGIAAIKLEGLSEEYLPMLL
ncbi:MAG: leucine-rich repeat domain-containing protein [Tissierellales bacterium]|nr:leucine-rich repeat domain-containing protein [Tissierellales bacterium]